MQPSDQGQQAVTTVAEFLRFTADVEPALPLIEGADQDIHVLVEDFGWAGFLRPALWALTAMNASWFHGSVPW